MAHELVASGSIRTFVGVTALVKHIASVAWCSIIDLFKSTPNGCGHRVFKHITYSMHDIGNIVRGSIEILPVVVIISFFIFGPAVFPIGFLGFCNNIFLLGYDSLIGRFSYSVEYTGVHYPKQYRKNPERIAIGTLPAIATKQEFYYDFCDKTLDETEDLLSVLG